MFDLWPFIRVTNPTGFVLGFTTDDRIRVTNPNPNWQLYKYKRSVTFDLRPCPAAPSGNRISAKQWQQNKMAASIERSRDMQTRNCDVVAAPPGDRIIAKQHDSKTRWRHVHREVTWYTNEELWRHKSRDGCRPIRTETRHTWPVAPLVTVSPQKALDQSEQSKLGHKPSTQLTGSAPGDGFTTKGCNISETVMHNMHVLLSCDVIGRHVTN